MNEVRRTVYTKIDPLVTFFFIATNTVTAYSPSILGGTTGIFICRRVDYLLVNNFSVFFVSARLKWIPTFFLHIRE